MPAVEGPMRSRLEGGGNSHDELVRGLQSFRFGQEFRLVTWPALSRHWLDLDQTNIHRVSSETWPMVSSRAMRSSSSSRASVLCVEM